MTTPFVPVRRPVLRWRAVLSALLLGGFYALPWLRWEGRQALLFDLPARRFDLFGCTLWPQDAGVLFSLVAALACALLLLTVLAGRVWCGHACPQTLWGGLYRWIEQRCAGLLQRPALAEAMKHAAWAGVALWTGITFVGLFTPIRALVDGFWPAHWSGWETFWVLFYATATWGNAAFLRGQVCLDLCPFARVAPSLCDADTPRPCYDARRAEPRGARERGHGSVQQRGRGLLDPTSASDYAFRAAHPALAGPLPRFAEDRLGDCLDCAACVQACPMQLDVRAGPQPDCIACGACVDACDAQMRAWRFPAGLIRIASANAGMGRRTHWVRPRVLALLACLLAVLGLGLRGL